MIEILKKIAERSHRINMHTHGCATRGREKIPTGNRINEIEFNEPEIVYGQCDCGWVDLAKAINQEIKKHDS